MNGLILNIFPNDFHFLVYTGLIILLGQIAGRLSNYFHAPRIIGYIITGTVMGPYALNFFTRALVEEQLSLLVEIALAIIAFSIGGALRNESIKPLIRNVMAITLFQALGAFFFVFFVSLAILPIFLRESSHLILSGALVLGAVSVPTAPAAIMSLVHELRSKGKFTTVLLGIVAVDDALAIILYGFIISIVKAIISGNNISIIHALVYPMMSCLISLSIGLIVALFIIKITKYFGSRDLLLGVMIGAIMFTSGIASSLDASPLLASMMLGYIIINFTTHEKSEEIYELIEGIEEPIFGIFFVLAGAHLNIDLAFKATGIALTMLIFRFTGKIAGCYAGAAVTGSSSNMKKYLGITLLPSAGVTIALIFDAAPVFATVSPSITEILISAIIGKTLINEVISPFLVRYALLKTGEASVEGKATIKQPVSHRGRAGKEISHHIKHIKNNKCKNGCD